MEILTARESLLLKTLNGHFPAAMADRLDFAMPQRHLIATRNIATYKTGQSHHRLFPAALPLTRLAFGLVFASVAGIMVYISLDELLPTAEEYGEHHLAIGDLIGEMLVMAVSLLLFA